MPFALLAALDHGLRGRVEPLAGDLSVHARLLIAVPLLVLAEVVLDRLAREAVGRLAGEGFVPPGALPRFRAVLANAARLRDSRAAEALIAFASLAAGAAALAGWLDPGGLASGVGVLATVTPARVWYALVGLPAFHFLLWRALWRWAIWARVLGGVARLPLRLAATHPDRRGGIAFLERPSLAFAVVAAFAASCVLCGAWATLMLHGARLSSFEPAFIAFAVAGEALAFAPLLPFAPRLFLARRAARHEYGALATDYSRQFHRRWIERRERERLLGTPDLQSLADLGNSWRELIDKMSPFLFSARDAAALLVAMLLPVIPLLLMETPVAQLLARLARLLAGGTR